jgi:hypothetical protein
VLQRLGIITPKPKPNHMSILLDRLCGYDLDESVGKDKLPIHTYVDSLYANTSTWTDKPTDVEIETMFSLSGQSYDPTNTQVQATASVRALITDGTRTFKEIEVILRMGERFPGTFTKDRVQAMLGITLQ